MLAVRPGLQDDVRNLTVMLNASESTLVDNGPAALNPVKGFLCLNDSIPMNMLENAFEAGVEMLAHHINTNVHNTLFVNFWMMDEKQPQVATNILFEVFAQLPHLEFVVWVCPINFAVDEFVQQNFSLLLFDKESYGESGLTPKQVFGNNKVLFFHRSVLLPRLQVRAARVEDNDDLIPIIQQSNPTMLEGQSSYFLAELIDSQDHINQICVGLQDQNIQGMLATSLDVNMSLIMKIFNIDAYPDLVIKADQLPLPAPLTIGVIGDLRLLNAQAAEIAISHQHCMFVNTEKLKRDSAESKNDESAFDLSAYIQKLVDEHGDPNLQAIVFWGFPRSEQDVSDCRHTIVKEFDLLFELTNTSEDAEDEDEDEFLQQHLDAVEILREYFFSCTADHPTPDDPAQTQGQPVKVSWKKIAYDKENYQHRTEDLHKLMNVLSASLEDRRLRVEATKAINAEKPPRANGFAVTALCLHEEFHSRALDLVQYAFEQQRDLDYCLFMLPCHDPPTLLTRCFNYVEARPGVSFDQSLYILHRAYFFALEHLSVARLGVRHLDDAYAFLQQAVPSQRDRQAVIEAVQVSMEDNDVELLDNPGEVSFAAFLGQKMVGVMSFSRKMLSAEDMVWLRDHYHLDGSVDLTRHRLKNQYMLKHLHVDAVVSLLARTMLTDVMRRTHKTVFFHHLDKRDRPCKEVLEAFAMLRPRRKPQGALGETAPRPTHPSHVPVFAKDCPLFFVAKSQLACRKDIVTKRVVVAGGSCHAFAFLETLCSVPSAYFPNLYLVLTVLPPAMKDAAGIESESAEESKHDEEYSGCLSLQDVEAPTTDELWSMAYLHRVNIVRGHLTDIDREHKAIVLSDELVLEYDYLLLSTCTQDNSARRIPSLQNIHPAKCADMGIFALGNPQADLLALTFVKKRVANRSESVVIAGRAVKVFAAAEGLIRSGVESSKIACVIEEATHHIETCGEVSLSKLVAQSAQVAGITDVYFRAGISEASLGRTGFLQSVDLYEIQSAAHSKLDKDRVPPPPSIPCTALLLCHGPEYQTVERDVFAAINDCGLVFDGGLVVDLTFRTVDPCIYAVSDYTKFSRVLRDDTPHARFNPRETGTYVALQMLRNHLHPHPARVNPRAYMHNAPETLEPRAEHLQNKLRTKPILLFSLPRSMGGPLPGDMHYLYSALPRPPRDLVGYVTDNAVVPKDLVRTGPPPPRRITLLKTDSFGTVTELTYAGLDVVEPRNLAQVVGKHEAFLNSAVHAHHHKLVEDWVEFFRMPWASVIYQDSFPRLVATLKKDMASDKGMIMLLSRIFERAELEKDNVVVGEYRVTLVGAHGEQAPEITKKVIEVETMEYLRENKDFLPKVHIPAMH